MIRDNITGDIREFSTEFDDEYGNFQWGPDGNFGCDCNRQLFFRRANGEDEDWDCECSEILFSVNIINRDTGAVLYREYESTNHDVMI